MFRAILYFHYYQVHNTEKVMHVSYYLNDDALVRFQDCEHDFNCWDDFVKSNST
jgi:hypothetical protein